MRGATWAGARYGGAAHDLAATHDVALETLASFPSRIWEPSARPLCAKGVPLSELASRAPSRVRSER
jgi:hypothetical protein